MIYMYSFCDHWPTRPLCTALLVASHRFYTKLEHLSWQKLDLTFPMTHQLVCVRQHVHALSTHNTANHACSAIPHRFRFAHSSSLSMPRGCGNTSLLSCLSATVCYWLNGPRSTPGERHGVARTNPSSRPPTSRRRDVTNPCVHTPPYLNNGGLILIPTLAGPCRGYLCLYMG